MNIPQAVRSTSQPWLHLPPMNDPPSPLNRNDFDDVKFWTKSSWNSYKRAHKGATDGNANKGKKPGRPEKESPDDDSDSLEQNTTHIYLETEGGVPVSKALLTQQGQKLRSLWTTLSKYDLAPKVWSEADSLAVRFIDSAILNDPRFHYLRLCDDNWKLKHWMSKNYPSWVKNHRATDGGAKGKRVALDDENLLKITPDPSDNENPVDTDTPLVPSDNENPVNTVLGPSNVVSYEESSNTHDDITMEPSSSSHLTMDLNIVDPLQDDSDDTDERLNDQLGMPAGCPEAISTQSPTSQSDSHTVLPVQTSSRQPPTSQSDSHTLPPVPTDAHADGGQPQATISVRNESVPAPATVDGTVSSTSALPVPTDLSLTNDLPQLTNGPAPKKRRVAAPAIVSESISDKNLCRQDWLKSHLDGTENQFKAHWLGLPKEEIKRWKELAAVQRKARNERNKKKA